MVVIAAGCSGHGTSQSALPVSPSPTASPSVAPSPTATSSVTPTATATTAALPANSTITGSVTLPAVTSGSGSLAITVSNQPPSGAPALQSAHRSVRSIGATALAYVTFGPSANMTFATEPSLTLTLPSGTNTANTSFSLALYDSSKASLGYQAASEGPVQAVTSGSTSTVTFTGQARATTWSAATTYTFALYAVAKPANLNLYVLDGPVGPDPSNNYTANVYVYPLTANNNVAPSRTLNVVPPAGLYPQGIAEDGAGNIYVTSVDGNATGAVQVFAAGASGKATPVRTIVGPNTGLLATASDSYVDGNGNLWVNNSTDYVEFAPGATGNATPVNTVTGLASGGIAVQPDGTLYEAHAGTSVNIYMPGATAAATPYTQIPNAGTGIGILTLDSANNLYTVTGSSYTSPRSVVVFAQGAKTPTRTIASPAIAGAQPLAVDPLTNNLWVANQAGIGANVPAIAVFGPTANGSSVTPIQTIGGSNVPIMQPLEILIGP